MPDSDTFYHEFPGNTQCNHKDVYKRQVQLSGINTGTITDVDGNF